MVIVKIFGLLVTRVRILALGYHITFIEGSVVGLRMEVVLTGCLFAHRVHRWRLNFLFVVH